MYRILLLGSTGKIGKYVLNDLLQYKGFDVRLLLRKPVENETPCVSFFQGDITAIDSLREGIAWCDVVVNCAGVVSYKAQDHSILNQINVDGTKNILETCTKFSKPLLHTSSAVVYGSTKSPLAQSENDNDSNGYLSGYALSKLTADQLIQRSSVKSIILRPSTMISSYGSTFSKLLALYRNGFRAGLHGGASFVKPDDISQVFGRAILYLLNNDFQNVIFNIGGNNILIKEVFDFFRQHEFRKTYYISSALLHTLSLVNDSFLLPVFKKSILTRENYKTGSLFTYLNSDKAKQELGYTITPFSDAAKNILNNANHG